MKRYQISASIVVFRSDPEELAASVRSVMASPVHALCTVVDNSPTPDLRTVALENSANYVFTGENLGFGRGHNLVLRQNSDSAEFHLIQNPDVRFSADVLPELYDFMSENRDVGLVMPQILNPDGTEQRLCKRLPAPLDLIARRFLGKFGERLFRRLLSRYELHHLDMSVTREVPSLSGCFMFVSNPALEWAGLFDERFFMYMEDVDLCRRIGMHYKTVFYPHVSVTHGYAKGSYQEVGLLRHHVLSAVRYFSKWGWLIDFERQLLNGRVAEFSAGRKQEAFSD